MANKFADSASGAPKTILGIKCHGHDSGAAIFTDISGKAEYVAISEARLSRTKHSYAYPLLSIRYVMDHFNIDSFDQIDLICIDNHIEKWVDGDSQYNLYAAANGVENIYGLDHRQGYLIEKSIAFPKDKIRYVNHVDAHAASAFHVSGFEQSAVVVIEGGVGCYLGDKNSISVVDRTGYGGDEYLDGEVIYSKADGMPPRRGNTAHLYSLITEKLGLDAFAAGKTMAVAAYADRFPKVDYLNMPDDRLAEGYLLDYSKLLQRIYSTIPQFAPSSRDNCEDELIAEYWVNISREVQKALEEDVMHLVNVAAEKTNSRNLSLAGGVALSCVTNRKILDLGLFDNVFIQPAASDEGIPLGCALWGYYQLAGGQKKILMDNAYLGRPNNRDELPTLLDDLSFSYRKTSEKEVADILSAGKIIGRINEGSEYGPRALGNRSILADPRTPNMLEIVNTQIKHRERYRPFAPSSLEDKQQEYFDLPCPSPFMILACKVHENVKDVIPAVVHVDGSSRVQTVREDQNQSYYRLIKEFGDLTGVYVLLNTSFNDNGEAIVETYEDAIISFLRTGLDYLYVEDILVERPDPDTCQNLLKMLTEKVTRNVQVSYARQIEQFCDMERYDRHEKSLKIWNPAYWESYVQTKLIKLRCSPIPYFVSIFGSTLLAKKVTDFLYALLGYANHGNYMGAKLAFGTLMMSKLILETFSRIKRFF